MDALTRLKNMKLSTYLDDRVAEAIKAVLPFSHNLPRSIETDYQNLLEYPGQDGLDIEIKMEYSKMTDAVLEWVEEAKEAP